MKFVSFAVLASFALSATAHAQATDEKAKDRKDPNRMICRSDASTGSRISKNRTCMTAAQWEEQRRQQRMQVEQMQNTRYKNN